MNYLPETIQFSGTHAFVPERDVLLAVSRCVAISARIVAVLSIGLCNVFAGGNDTASAIATDSSENVYVTGSTTNNGAFDYATLKYNSSGVQQWKALYNGTGNYNDTANAVTSDSSGNVYVTGSSVGSGSGADFVTIKYNSAGVQQWVARYNGPANGDDIANAIAVDASGNVYVTGGSLGSGSGKDYATVKYNSSGVQQWVVRLNGTGNGDDISYALAVDSSGNVYVTGSSLGTSGGTDYFTAKYNSTGTQKWTYRWTGYGNGGNVATAIAVDASGNVYVTGRSLATSVGLNYMTIKLNTNGALVWWNDYNGPANGDDQAVAIAVDASNNVYITGSSLGSSVGLDYATVKYTSTGAFSWAARYNGTASGDDKATALTLDASANVYVTGSSLGLGGGTDYATIKYNSSGSQLWASRYNGAANGNDGAVGISVNSTSGNVYVTGTSLGSGTGTDYATVKYNSSGAQQWATRYDGP